MKAIETSSIISDLIPCVPPFWARGGHLQTMLGHLIKSPRIDAAAHPHETYELKLADGDTLVGRYYPGTTNQVIYLFHGLGGNADADYIQRAAIQFLSQGHTVLLFNHRGCGEGRGLANKPYHSGSAEDLSAAIEYGRQREPHKKHIAMGVSLSGNALLLLCSGQRGSVLPDAAIAVNAPINLRSSAVKLNQGWNNIYDIRFVFQARLALLNKKLKKSLNKVFHVPVSSTLYEFDEAYTAPASGFKNRAEYYETCSAQKFIHQIKIPTVILTAKDDPFIDYQEYLSVKYPSNVHFHLENFGGHVGYLHHRFTPLGSMRWLDYALDYFLKKLV